MANYLCFVGGTIAGGYPWSNRWYATSSESEGSVESTWSSAIVSMYTTSTLQGLLPTSTIVSETYTSTLNSAWKQTTKTTDDHDIAGTATQALPPHLCQVVTWRSAQATKYGRGRWYLPCMATGALATDGSFLSTAAVTALVDGLNNLLTGITGVIQPVLLHRVGTKSGPGALTTDNIVSGDVPNGFDTQRRRADKYVPTRVSVTF
jgi:hypothetical protein